jgi:hypothetical protein
MSRDNPNKFHYFSPVTGHVVARYGSTGYIGAVRDPKQGFNVDPDVVVRIPDAAYRSNLKAYRRAVKDGSLIARTANDYDNYVKRAAEKADAEAKAKRAAEAQSEPEGNDPDDGDEHGNSQADKSNSQSLSRKKKKENNR